jgi:hypothetical protein
MFVTQKYDFHFGVDVAGGKAIRLMFMTSNRLLHSRAPLIRINWGGEPSGYAENTDNWIFI